MNNAPNVQTRAFSGFQIAKTDGTGAGTNLDLALGQAQIYGYWRGSCASFKITMTKLLHFFRIQSLFLYIHFGSNSVFSFSFCFFLIYFL